MQLSMSTRVTGGSMKKRVGLVLVAGALMAPAWAGSASAIPNGPPDHASGPRVGECPKGDGAEWFLAQPSGPEHLSAHFDFNNDGFICARWLPAFDGQSAVTFKDNVGRWQTG